MSIREHTSNIVFCRWGRRNLQVGDTKLAVKLVVKLAVKLVVKLAVVRELKLVWR